MDSRQVLHRYDSSTSKGIKFHVISGSESGPSVDGVFIFTHGYSEHAGRYFELAQNIVLGTDRTWASIVYDVRGHGDSPGVRGFISNFDEYLADLDDIVRVAEVMAKRIVLCGHSNGGLITLRWLTDKRRTHLRSHVQAGVLCAPFLRMYEPLNLRDSLLVRILGVLAPQIQTPFKPNFEMFLTHDETIQKMRREDSKCFNASTVGWVYQSQLTQAKVKKTILASAGTPFPIKTYWLVPGQDFVCNPDIMKKVAKKMNGTVFDYPDLYHEMFLESNRQALIARVIDEVILPLKSARL